MPEFNQDVEDARYFLGMIPDLWRKTRNWYLERVRDGRLSPADVEALVAR